jgi:hypothetical protein
LKSALRMTAPAISGSVSAEPEVRRGNACAGLTGLPLARNGNVRRNDMRSPETLTNFLIEWGLVECVGDNWGSKNSGNARVGYVWSTRRRARRLSCPAVNWTS